MIEREREDLEREGERGRIENTCDLYFLSSSLSSFSISLFTPQRLGEDSGEIRRIAWKRKKTEHMPAQPMVRDS